MTDSRPGFNPYTDGHSSKLGKLVAALMIVTSAAFAAYYLKIGYDNARDECIARTSDLSPQFSLTWTPPFTKCVVSQDSVQSA